MSLRVTYSHVGKLAQILLVTSFLGFSNKHACLLIKYLFKVLTKACDTGSPTLKFALLEFLTIATIFYTPWQLVAIDIKLLLLRFFGGFTVGCR